MRIQLIIPLVFFFVLATRVESRDVQDEAKPIQNEEKARGRLARTAGGFGSNSRLLDNLGVSAPGKKKKRMEAETWKYVETGEKVILPCHHEGVQPNRVSGSLEWQHEGALILTAYYGDSTTIPVSTTIDKFEGNIQLEPSEDFGYGALIINQFEKPMEGEFVCIVFAEDASGDPTPDRKEIYHLKEPDDYEAPGWINPVDSLGGGVIGMEKKRMEENKTNIEKDRKERHIRQPSNGMLDLDSEDHF